MDAWAAAGTVLQTERASSWIVKKISHRNGGSVGPWILKVLGSGFRGVRVSRVDRWMSRIMTGRWGAENGSARGMLWLGNAIYVVGGEDG